MKKGLEPVIDDKTNILIIGTFPSEKALEKKEYYAHPTNAFWRLIGEIFDADITEKSYQEKIQFLTSKKIGLWNIYLSCNRKGSLDINIKDAKLIDFKKLKDYPNIQHIFSNGKLKDKYYQKFIGMGYKITLLPSSSAACASIPYREKLDNWRKLAEIVSN